MDKRNIEQACTVLRAGGVIAYPTEAVWGLGCDPFNAEAVRRILALKQRAQEKGLIVVAANMEQIANLTTELTQSQLASLASTWPGPTSWVIPDNDALFPTWVKGSYSSIAVRVSAHPVVKALCSGFGKPLVSTSANIAGKSEIRSRLILMQEFGDKLDFVVEGELGEQERPSEIRDLVSGNLIR